jgi:thioredoxin 2
MRGEMVMVEEVSTAKATVSCPFCLTLNRVDLSRAGDRPKCGSCGKPILVDRPVRVSDADFERVIGGTTVPVLVDFYADWCGPCKAMAPVLDDLAAKRTGRLLVVKLDTDANPQTATRFGIRGIPTLILFRDGREAGREVGAVPRQRLEQLVGA